jgi:hypothetical protein
MGKTNSLSLSRRVQRVLEEHTTNSDPGLADEVAQFEDEYMRLRRIANLQLKALKSARARVGNLVQRVQSI